MPASSKRKTWVGRVCVERVRDGTRPDGQPRYRERSIFVGRFKTKRERDEAVMRRRIELEGERQEQARPLAERLSCAGYADEFVERMESGDLRTKAGRRYKDSSIDTARSQLAHFKREYGDRPLSWLDSDDAAYEAARWAPQIPAGCVQTTVILVNRAVAERLLTYNPFKGLGRRVEGRANEARPASRSSPHCWPRATCWGAMRPASVRCSPSRRTRSCALAS